MYTDNLINVHSNLDQQQNSDYETGTLDLSILTTMARQVETVRQCVEQETSALLPAISSTVRADERVQRVVIYRPQPTTQHPLQFVGFVSKRHPEATSATLTRMMDIDKTLVMELAEHSGLLYYSSLEFAEGIWYNLVVFTQTEVKGDILAMKTHRVAAYELAPSYYQWIRLHHGVLPGGRLTDEMVLNRTKFYTFHALAQQPDIRLQTCDMMATVE